MIQPLLHLLSALHARGFHAAVLAGLIMMPAVVTVGCLTDRAGVGRARADDASIGLRGSLSEAPPSPPPAPVGF